MGCGASSYSKSAAPVIWGDPRVKNVEKLLLDANDYATERGYEIHPFKVGWYNSMVEEAFHLPYTPETVAFILISTPDMFEKNFIPFIKARGWTGTRDPVDESVTTFIDGLQDVFEGRQMEVLHDYDLDPATRRPVILVQTAGHVAGAAFFYQRKHVREDYDWETDQKVCGVCIHPTYGGWFAFRGVVIVPELKHPHLERKDPPDVVTSEEKRVELLKLFNYHWRDSRFRDIIEAKKKYSEMQLEYFNTPPKEREGIVNRILGQDQGVPEP